MYSRFVQARTCTCKWCFVCKHVTVAHNFLNMCVFWRVLSRELHCTRTCSQCKFIETLYKNVLVHNSQRIWNARKARLSSLSEVLQTNGLMTFLFSDKILHRGPQGVQRAGSWNINRQQKPEPWGVHSFCTAKIDRYSSVINNCGWLSEARSMLVSQNECLTICRIGWSRFSCFVSFRKLVLHVLIFASFISFLYAQLLILWLVFVHQKIVWVRYALKVVIITRSTKYKA